MLLAAWFRANSGYSWLRSDSERGKDVHEEEAAKRASQQGIINKAPVAQPDRAAVF
jgi:hypothetical protein